jgi:hypothetical protein
MTAIVAVAAALERRGVARVVCPMCGVACAAPTERSLEGVACTACLRPLAPEPADRPHVQALRELAQWWDRSRVPGRGYTVVTCPSCSAGCVVPVGSRMSGTACIACLRSLGSGPHVRFDLAGEGGAEREEHRGRADAAGDGRLTA